MKKAFLLLLFPLVANSALFIDEGIPANARGLDIVVKMEVVEDHFFFGTRVLSICTATMITPDIALTAAHCITGLKTAYTGISLVGDNKGKVIVYEGGKHVNKGILIEKAYVNPDYYIARDEYERNAQRRMGREFIDMTPAERVELEELIVKLGRVQSGKDVAFVKLSSPQKVDTRKLPSISCREKLYERDAILFAGYGRNSPNGIRANNNADERLLVGENIINQTFEKDVYSALKDGGPNLVNSGDSGGPLFKKGSYDQVFGVSVLRLNDENGRNKESLFVNLSSESSKKFFKTLLKEKDLSKDFKSKIQDCF